MYFIYTPHKVELFIVPLFYAKMCVNIIIVFQNEVGNINKATAVNGMGGISGRNSARLDVDSTGSVSPHFSVSLCLVISLDTVSPGKSTGQV